MSTKDEKGRGKQKYEIIDIVEKGFHELTTERLADKWKSFFLRYNEAGVNDSGQSILKKPYIEQLKKMGSLHPNIFGEPGKTSTSTTTTTTIQALGRKIFQIDYNDLVEARSDILGIYEPDEEEEEEEKQRNVGEDEPSIREIDIKILCFGIKNEWDRTREAIKSAILTLLKRVNKDYVDRLEREKSVDDIIINLTNFEITKPLMDIGSHDLEKVVRVRGVISEFDDSASIQVSETAWKCRGCDNVTPISGRKPPTKCPNCSEKLFEENPVHIKSQDFMYFVLQDPHESLKQGQLIPPSKNVSITGTDFVDSVYSIMAIGKTVAINGIPRLAELVKGNSLIASVEIECIGIEVVNENIAYDDKLRAEVSKDIPQDEIEEHYEKLKRSMAPWLEGLEPQKEAILLQTIGAPPLQVRGQSSKMRGDINILLLGDAATGKSEMLHFAHSLNPNAIYVQGQNASKVGLTAAIKTTEVLRAGQLIKKTSLTAGVYGMVSKPGGLVCLDELTKVANDEHYEVMSSAMDDFSTMYIHKNVAHTEIKVNCASLHAANPVTNKGRYDVTLDGPSQTNFHTWLWSRYDLKFLHIARRDDVSRHLLWQRKAESFSQMEYAEGFDSKGLKFGRRRKSADIFSRDYLMHEIAFLREKYLPFVEFETGKLPWLTLMEFWNYYNSKSATPTRQDLDRGDLMSEPLLDERAMNSLIRLSMASAVLHRRYKVTVEDVANATNLMKISIAQFIPKIDEKDSELRSVASAQILLSEGLKKAVELAAREKNESMQNFVRGMVKAVKILHRELFMPCEECKGRGVIQPDSPLTNEDKRDLKEEKYADKNHIPCHSCLGMRGSYQPFDYPTFQRYMFDAKISIYTKEYFELLRRANMIVRDSDPTVMYVDMAPRLSGVWKVVRDLQGNGIVQMTKLANEMLGGYSVPSSTAASTSASRR